MKELRLGEQMAKLVYARLKVSAVDAKASKDGVCISLFPYATFMEGRRSSQTKNRTFILAGALPPAAAAEEAAAHASAA